MEECVNLNEPLTGEYLHSLAMTYSILDPVVRTIVEALHLPSGSRGLDVGCGLGHPTISLADAVGPSGHVAGIDISTEFIEYAKGLAQDTNFSERTTFQQGDFNKLPFEDNTFDWVWSKDCVGYNLGESLHPLKELIRVIKPGGSVILALWSSQMLLPGYPILEAHLNATSSGIAPFMKDMRPELHYYRLLGRFPEVGLENRTIKTFVGDVHAPINETTREALSKFFPMRWPDVESELSKDDWKQYQPLSDPKSSDYILDLPDYYAFFTYSVFRGKKS